MGTNNEKKTEQIEALKSRLFECRDKEQFESLFTELSALLIKDMQVPVELSIPSSEVKDSIDFGSCKISRTVRGFLLEAKGGMFTFIDWRMKRPCTFFETLFHLYHKKDKTAEEQTALDNFQTALLYCFQTLIFATMSEVSLYTIAASIANEFTRCVKDTFDKGQKTELDEQDYKDDADWENISEAVDTIYTNLPKSTDD